LKQKLTTPFKLVLQGSAERRQVTQSFPTFKPELYLPHGRPPDTSQEIVGYSLARKAERTQSDSLRSGAQKSYD
jgi:hypothetical protein